jgi:hypothetical protein
MAREATRRATNPAFPLPVGAAPARSRAYIGSVISTQSRS